MTSQPTTGSESTADDSPDISPEGAGEGAVQAEPPESAEAEPVDEGGSEGAVV